MIEFTKLLQILSNLINQQTIIQAISQSDNNNNSKEILMILQELVKNVTQKLLAEDVPKENQKDIQTINMNITAIKVTPDTLLSNYSSLNSSVIQLPKEGLLKIPKRFSEQELPNDEEIYNMKIINWIANPQKTNTSAINSNILSIELDLLNVNQYQLQQHTTLHNNITFTQQHINLSAQQNSSTYECSYYSYTTNNWESNGCSIVAENKQNITCRCNHLTDFGLSSSDFNKVYYNTNLKSVFEQANHSNFNLFRSPSFYVLALLSYVCLSLIIQARITQPYHDIETQIINQKYDTPFLRYSYLYSKIKNKGSKELKSYLKKIGYLRAFLRDFYRAYKVGHPLIGRLTGKSAFISRSSRLFIYYLRCLGVIGTSLIFYKDPNVQFGLKDKLLISLLTVPITSRINISVNYFMKFRKPRKIRRYFYAGYPINDEDEHKRQKISVKNILGICIGLMFSTFVMYAMFAIETQITEYTKREWIKTYLLGFFTSQVLIPPIKALLNCVLVIIIARQPIDSATYDFAKKIINQDLVTQYNF